MVRKAGQIQSEAKNRRKKQRERETGGKERRQHEERAPCSHATPRVAGSAAWRQRNDSMLAGDAGDHQRTPFFGEDGQRRRNQRSGRYYIGGLWTDVDGGGGRSITLRCVSTGGAEARSRVVVARPPGSGLRFAPRACLCSLSSLLLLSLRERTLRNGGVSGGRERPPRHVGRPRGHVAEAPWLLA